MVGAKGYVCHNRGNIHLKAYPIYQSWTTAGPEQAGSAGNTSTSSGHITECNMHHRQSL